MFTGSGKKCKYLGNIRYALLIKPLVCIEYLIHNLYHFRMIWFCWFPKSFLYNVAWSVTIHVMGHNEENETALLLVCRYPVYLFLRFSSHYSLLFYYRLFFCCGWKNYSTFMYFVVYELKHLLICLHFPDHHSQIASHKLIYQRVLFIKLCRWINKCSP